MKKLKKLALVMFALVLSLVTFASCGDSKPKGAELAAKKVVLTQDKSKSVTEDFKVTMYVDGDDDIRYTVSWESNNDYAVIGDYTENGEVSTSFKLVSIRYINNLETDQEVKLTATVSNPDKKESFVKEFNFGIPKFVETTIDEYDAAKDGTSVTVKGIVVAKEPYSASYKNTSVYIQDISGKGGYDAYRVSCATQEAYDNDLAIGNTILVTGPKKIYNGLREFDSCSYVLVSSDKVTPKDTDLTTLINTGKDSITKDLQCQLAHFTELTVVSVGTTDKNGNWNIVVGDADDENKQFTVRINTYLTPKDGDVYKSFGELGLVEGAVVSVKGVLGWYSGAQLHPLNTGDIVVVSVPQPKTYSITYTSAHGTAPAKAEGVTALPESLPVLADVEGWHFVGWYLEDTFTTAATAGAALTEDATLYAKWEEVKAAEEGTFNITFNMAGHGEAPTTINSVTALPDPLPSVAVKGWHFRGWYLDAEYKTAATAGAEITENTTLFAKWEEAGFIGVVTAVGFKAVSNNVMRAYALVQNADGEAKFVYISAPIDATNTEEAAKAAINAKFVVGKTVEVKGTNNDYNGLNQWVVEWDKLATDVILGDTATLPAYTDITAKVGNEDELKTIEGLLVKVTGTYDNGKLVVGEKTINVYYENAFLSENPFTDLKNGGVYTISGYLNYYNVAQISPISAECVVVVDESGVLTLPEITIDATISFADDTKRTEQDNDHQLWVDNGITVLGEKSASTTNVAASKDPARFYKSSDITVSAEQNITAIVITFSASNYMPSAVSIDGCLVDLNTTTLTCTIVLNTPAKSLKIENLDKQWRIVSIGVDFAE